MEITFENKTADTYREIYHQTKRVQESTESVVPDTDDDIGEIISVQSDVMLKSKDVTPRGVLVSGEACASVMYITENREAVSFVRMSRLFTIEYEIADISSDAVPTIKLSVLNTETRIINPRKLSVMFEIGGELSCYRQETVNVQSLLPALPDCGLHARYEKTPIVFTNAVAEKTFAVSEQFTFPSGKPRPEKLICERVDFQLSDNQLVGTKLIVKGNVNVAVRYLSSETVYPVYAEFSTPFSQIIDTGREQMDICLADAEQSSGYFSLVETMNGDKVLDTEIHAVLQVVTGSRQELEYISDIYSNVMPASFNAETRQYNAMNSVRSAKLSSEEKITTGEDCAEVLNVFGAVSGISFADGKIRAGAVLDILYRTEGGDLACVKRSITLECEVPEKNVRISEYRISDMFARPEGQSVDLRICVEVTYLDCVNVTLDKIGSVELNEQEKYDLRNYPSVHLVRVEEESLWELAKQYHSNIEKIKEVNQIEEITKGSFLLIPKAI